MANNFQDSVIDALRPGLDEAGCIDIDTALDLVSEFDFESDANDPLAYFERETSAFELDPVSRTIRVLDASIEENDADDDENDGAKKYPIPPRDFQFNGRLIKLMNAMADENTPEDGLYFAQFAKAAKEHNLATPPHEEKLLSYCRLYPRVFTITVDPSASQKIYIKPIKGFKSYKKDRKPFGAEKPYGFKGAHSNAAPYMGAHQPQVKERTLSLYSLSDFAFFPDLNGALKNLYEMAAPTDGCFLIEGDVNPYRMLLNKLERDFAEAVRREYDDSEQLFGMSPIGADFPTGFSTPEGRRIFGSCEFNKVRNAESYQPWRFTGFYAEEENA
ncbi:MAG: hypothetical protein K2M06_06860 [Muribaculaceae bacterium]|nr:hypothetical protein [Muribaculaceae bacterium]